MNTEETQKIATVNTNQSQPPLIEGKKSLLTRGKKLLTSWKKPQNSSLFRALKPSASFLVGAVVVSIISWYLSDPLLDQLIPKPPTSVPQLPSGEVDIAALQKHLESLNQFRSSFDSLRTSLKIIGAILAGVITAVVGSLYKNYKERGEAFETIWEAKGTRKIDNNLRRYVLPHLNKRWDKRVMSLIELSEKHSYSSKYAEQLNIADIFSQIAQQKFWATSLDLPSEFWMRNENYFDSMEQMNISGVEDDGIPKLCRVFVAPFKDFVKDIAKNSVEVTEAFQWHLEWNKESGGHDPIRFLMCEEDYRGYLELFSDGHKALDEANRIPDFMIVDDQFVYGRRSLTVGQERSVLLGYLPGDHLISANSTVSTVYPDIFRSIWNRAGEIDDMKKRIQEVGTETQQAIDELVNELSRRRPSPVENEEDAEEIKKQKEEIKKQKLAEIDAFFEHNLTFRTDFRNELEFDQRYGTYFQNAKDGDSLYERVKTRIMAAQETVVAVDRADKKEEGQRFYQAWTSQEEYKGFFEASKIAAKHSHVHRLFVIEDLVPIKDTLALSNFITSFLDAGMEIGIIQNNADILAQISDAFDSDFILTDVQENAASTEMFSRSFGFEMKDKDFKKIRLRYKDNLVAPGRFSLLYHRIFRRLWNDSACVKFENKQDLDENIHRLIK